MTAPPPSPPPKRAAADLLPFGPPFLIADPAAARRDLTLLRRGLAASGVVAEAAVARPVGRAGEIAARAMEDGHRLLVAVGSDRIVHAILRVLVDPSGPRCPDAVLGLAGLGRQDLSATFGLPDDPAKAARHLLGPNLFEADVGRARWRGPDGSDRVGVFANTAELGYPAEVSARTSASSAAAAGAAGVETAQRTDAGPSVSAESAQRSAGAAERLAGGAQRFAGRAGRFAAAVGGLVATRSTPARVEVDHTAVELRLAGLVVANGQFTMGRMKVAPRALPDDGRLSVMAFQGEPLGIYARSKDLYYGLHVPHPSVREYQSRR
ncbi:MAG TPA: diacylglycerol kinase family protein, partial [Actinomycetes bacterium]|nr:diacylglycerol kinase family protein [Actinomycetes bacterium]